MGVDSDEGGVGRYTSQGQTFSAELASSSSGSPMGWTQLRSSVSQAVNRPPYHGHTVYLDVLASEPGLNNLG